MAVNLALIDYAVFMIQDFIQFVMQNWFLWSLFILILFVIIWFETRTVVGGVTKIDAQSLVGLMNRENAAVFDVRDIEKYNDGHIVGAISIPNGSIDEKNKKFSKLKTKPIAIVCANGQNSMKIAQQFKKAGFEQPYILKGGINAWKEANYPLQKSS